VFASFVCLLAGLHGNYTRLIFTKLCGEVVHGPRKNSVDFVVDPYHVTSMLGFGLPYV